MSLVLTFWEDPRIKRTEDDFDGISEVRLKSIKQVPELVAARPKQTTMISVERTDKKGPSTNPHYFKEVWRKGQPSLNRPHSCPVCSQPLV